jgi:spermidine/putrescine transport system permease protein
MTATDTLERPDQAAEPPAPPSRRRRRMPDWLAGNVLLLPTSVWFAILLVIPMLIIGAYSLGQRSIYRPVIFSWSHLIWSNYADALNAQFLPIFIRSIVYAITATLLCVLLGFPLAYWIARFGGRLRIFYLVLVIIPFLTSYLVRMYGIEFILQRNGLLNTVLGHLGLGGSHEFLNTHFAVILGLTYGFLPFMILPLYASIERMDKSLVEASYDLGHGKTSTLFRVIIPAVSPGLIAGVLLVFIPAVGDYITAAILGGVKTQMIGVVINDQFVGSGNNWPLGSAMSILLTLFILIGVVFYLTRVGEEAL